ncbi:MAG: alpha/beta hydrolase family protein [Vulcanococcus sp.]|jgi:predicted dienelactone hydrolase
MVAATLLSAAPARAIEEVVLKLPLLQNTFRLKVSELGSSEALLRGNSDLAELDRASDGRIGRQLQALLTKPLPIDLGRATEQAVGTPMLEQAMLVLSSLGTVEGAQQDLTGAELNQALQRASAAGPLTLLSLIKAIPGQRVTLDLGELGKRLERMVQQRDEADALMAASTAAAPATTAAPQAVRRSEMELPVAHRPGRPLQLVVLEPRSGGNGRLVLISHGLWDSPSSFEGWAQLLAANGYSVVLPRHPGSDHDQQQAMLSGQAPPPGPDELKLRPKDISAVIDALTSRQLSLAGPVQTDRVVVVGHSWGATTSLQLAGLKPSSRALPRCNDQADPERNLSWVLQCSWLQGSRVDELKDQRVVAIAAVSPPVSLLFPPGAEADLSARVLLVSGSRDWVVPPDPEAVTPMRLREDKGNRLVLVQGGDHFNLRPGQKADGGTLGPLLLAWTEGAFQAGAAVRPSPSAPNLLPPMGWGQTGMALVDVTDRLRRP